MGEPVRTFAASVTPLRAGGSELDDEAIGPVVDFLARGGVDGLLAMGTTGEGILLTTEERRRAVELFVEAAKDQLDVFVHCGAQTTAATVQLAAHAGEIGADGVAVIGPPYFAFDERALVEHFAAAAEACAPTPFYIYEFAARAGYAVPASVIDRLRERAPNLVGLKVSDTPWERFEPYLIEGLEVFVGPEALISRGLARGAAGAVSGLAAAFPEAVAQVVSQPSEEAAARIGRVRAAVESFPFHAALKLVLRLRGLPVGEDVRPPLRTLDTDEKHDLTVLVEEFLSHAEDRVLR